MSEMNEAVQICMKQLNLMEILGSLSEENPEGPPLKSSYDIGTVSWSIGKWWCNYFTRLVVINGKIKSRNPPGDPLDLFNDCFPGILNKCKGDRIREATLFFIMCMFNYGYVYPGLGVEYARRESEEALVERPGGQHRRIILGD